MNFLINDCSLHGQFYDQSAFTEAIGRIMTIRETMRSSGCKLYCHKEIPQAKVSPNQSLLEAVSKMSHDQRPMLFRWLCEQGPFWDDDRHDSDEYFEHSANVVTDTAVGEAAYRCAHDNEHHLVSFAPSNWMYTPVTVCWHRSDPDVQEVGVCNHWCKSTVQATLEAMRPEIASWRQLCTESVRKFTNITFAEKCFAHLDGHPFVKNVATQISKRLHVLNQYQISLSASGTIIADSQQFRQKYFTGERSWFSNSSKSEQTRFKKELTFRHPDRDGEFLFCTWHGKVNSPNNPIRIHFSQSDGSLYVVYVGPKITKR